jgi:hypothetical protein
MKFSSGVMVVRAATYEENCGVQAGTLLNM